MSPMKIYLDLMRPIYKDDQTIEPLVVSKLTTIPCPVLPTGAGAEGWMPVFDWISENYPGWMPEAYSMTGDDYPDETRSN